jgi:hypothetical protein
MTKPKKNIDEAWRLNHQKKNSLKIFHGDFMEKWENGFMDVRAIL